jgi:hypothetical protein
MRQASFAVSGPGGSTADVSVVSFPGSGGDDLANINRWRNQLKLAPISAGDLSGEVQAMPVAAGQLVLADLAGTLGDNAPGRILGAWLRQPDRVWFFKMMGPSDLVESQKTAFIGFLNSLRVPVAAPGIQAPSSEAAPSSNTNDLPKNGPEGITPPVPIESPGAEMAAVPVQAGQGGSLLWTAPAGWRSQSGSAVRRGSYAVGGGAEVAITAFPGDVGGVLANVNRWRGQAGLDPVDDAGLGQVAAALDSNGLHFLVVDFSGAATPIVAALVPWGGGTWFFKLTGPGDAVARAKPAFLAFLRTVRTP